MTEIDRFLAELKCYRRLIGRQTLLTIRGQALAGDIAGARKGLQRIIKKLQLEGDHDPCD